MPLKDRTQKTLLDLGLTHSQAILYFTLTTFSNPASATAISSGTNIARQEVYRIIEELQKIGLVEKEIANPALFKAISVRDAIRILMEIKRKKYISLEKEIEDLLVKLPLERTTVRPQKSYQFKLIPQGKALVLRIENAIKTSNRKIIAMTPRRIFKQWIFNSHELWLQAIKRGVEVRWITEKQASNDPERNLETVDTLLTYTNFKLRTTSQRLSTRVGIYDNREVFLATNRALNAAKSEALWTNNLALVDILNDYFSEKWKSLKEANIT